MLVEVASGEGIVNVERTTRSIRAQERQVIPRAVELLTPEDWTAVNAIPAGPDPLFGTEVDARYGELRLEIEHLTLHTQLCSG
jgi:hypothetical protein